MDFGCVSIISVYVVLKAKRLYLCRSQLYDREHEKVICEDLWHTSFRFNVYYLHGNMRLTMQIDNWWRDI